MRKTKIILGLVCLLFAGLAFGYAGAVDQPSDFTKARIEKVADVYTAEIGVRELTGRNDGERVEQYLASTGFKKGAPWCAAFVTWCFVQADVDKTPRSAWSPAWFYRNVIYTKGKPSTDTPRRADTFGIYYSRIKRIGHIGFIDRWEPGDEFFIAVEGNTNQAGSREGDGVYRKRRLKSAVYKISRWV